VKPSSVFLILLFMLAVAFMILSLWLPPVVGGIAEEIGRQKAGKAIIPERVKEQWRAEGKFVD